MPSDGSKVLTAELIRELAGTAAPSAALPAATGAAFHSGRVRPGDAFFALPGASEHGIIHAERALERGAAYIVSDRPHPRGIRLGDPAKALLALGRHARARLRGPVIAISGSAGKTSTKSLASAALDASSSPGNFNTPLALACTLVSAWLSDPRRPLVVELGIDRPGEMDELVDLVQPSHGLLTAIGESHLERLGSVEGVAREKSRLLERCAERLASTGAAERLPRPLPGLVSYGLGHGAAVTGTVSRSDSEGQTVEALGISLRLPYPGTAMAENALAALALAWRLGIDLRTAAARMASARLEPGRLEPKRMGSRLVLDDSYNSNPTSSRQALALLATSPGPRVAILGDMLELGDQAEELHRELGALTRGLEFVLAIGPLARHIREGNPDAVYATGVEQALALLERLPVSGTVLVKASRGMRLERVVAALASEGEQA
ncbi:MAG: UDP-N-acetylmuramoyl-tripeptide--D-alanyl-D-alanine ligase [Trueperaceae bacterium]